MRRVYPVYRSTVPLDPAYQLSGERELPDPETGQSLDTAFDLYDADTHELVERGKTPRELREDGE